MARLLFVLTLGLSGCQDVKQEIFIKVPSVVLPQTPNPVTNRRDVDCLAKNIYHESRGESFNGKLGVANVTMNRLNAPGFPDDVCEVVYQKRKVCQFSWVCQASKRYTQEFDEVSWYESKQIARKTIDGEIKRDVTGGALFFHNNKVNPSWSRKRKKTVTIGRHHFYR